jgi:hypothetical protein
MATITLEHLYKNGTSEQGKVGDGATILMYSDTHPATIIARTAKTLTVQEDNHKIESGTWPDFQYSYSPNPNGAITVFHWSAKKGWQASGRRLLVGERRYYNDPTF